MLDLYRRIKERRTELGMTQQELAELIGYNSGKSMIARIERGDVDLSQSKIAQFAKALNTTPGYLMGWDASMLDNVDTDMLLETGMDGLTRQIMVETSRMTDEEKNYLLIYAKFLRSKQGS